MVPERVIPVSIALPRAYKDLLRKIALEESLKSNEVITLSRVGRDILCAFLRERLEELSKKEA